MAALAPCSTSCRAALATPVAAGLPRHRPRLCNQQQGARPRFAAAAATGTGRRRLLFGGVPPGAAEWGSSSSVSSRRAPAPAGAAAHEAAVPVGEPGGAAPPKCEERVHRLEAMIQLRKVYRNLLRGELLVEQPSPVYQPSDPAPDGGDDAAATAAAAEQQRRTDEAVEVVAEMELTAEQLKAGLRSLKACPYEYRLLFRPEQQAAAAAELEARIKSLFQMLSQRAEEEIALLPFPSVAAAQSAIDARNARFRLSIPWAPAGTDSPSGGGGDGDDAGPYSPGTISERLVKAEKAAEQFVTRRLQPAVQRTAGLVKETSPEGVVEGIKSSAVWAKGLWNRLNGATGQPFTKEAPFDLPLPVGSEEARRQAIQQLTVQLDALEKQLQDASKQRESRLRKAGLQGRARMASELRDMDNEIAGLSKALAVRTLQLEMEYVHGALEDEARDILGDSKGGDMELALSRRGSTEEVALLVAEFGLLDEQLGATAAAVEASEALFIDDAELARLATDIPDLRVRLGIGDTEVFGGQGFSLGAMQMRVREGVVKIADGVLFGVRGMKLLFGDIGSAGKLFWRAVRGGTLKPREVQALRRTVRDLLTFVPFTIILIIPLTPVGHVLIFGFIQRYFPGFFPSQFTSRRQQLMMKYDELKAQLRQAELQAEAENDEREYRQKAASAMAAAGLRGAAVANAVASGGGGSASDASASLATEDGEEEEGPAARAVRQIEEQLTAAEDETYTADVEVAEAGHEAATAAKPAAQQPQTPAPSQQQPKREARRAGGAR